MPPRNKKQNQKMGRCYCFHVAVGAGMSHLVNKNAIVIDANLIVLPDCPTNQSA
jgi:hypothetical protein